MAAPNADTFADPAKYRCNGLDVQLVEPLWKEVVGDFLRRSNAWQTEQGPWHIFANDPIVPLEPNPDGVVRIPLWVKVDDKLLPTTHWTCSEPGIIKLTTPYTEYKPLALVALCALAPSGNLGKPLPSWINDRHFDLILDGILAKLYIMPGKPWSNAQVGGLHYDNYLRGARRARVDAVAGYRQEDFSYTNHHAGWP